MGGDATATSNNRRDALLIMVCCMFALYLLMSGPSARPPHSSNADDLQLPPPPSTPPRDTLAAAASSSLRWLGRTCFAPGLVDFNHSLWRRCRDAKGESVVHPMSPADPNATNATQLLLPFNRRLHCALAPDAEARAALAGTPYTANADFARVNDTHQCVGWSAGAFVDNAGNAVNLTAADLQAVFRGALAARPTVCPLDALMQPQDDPTDGALQRVGETHRSANETLGPHKRLEVVLPQECRAANTSGVESFTRLEALAILHRAAANGTRSIVLSGDSMTRQLLARLIALVRGQEPATEHPGWFDVTYVVRGGGDELQFTATSPETVKRFLAEPDIAPFVFPKPLECRYGSGVPAAEQCLLHVRFLWEPKEKTVNRHMFSRNVVPVCVGSECPAVANSTTSCPLQAVDGIVDAAHLPAVHVHASMYWFIDALGKKKGSIKARRGGGAARPAASNTEAPEAAVNGADATMPAVEGPPQATSDSDTTGGSSQQQEQQSPQVRGFSAQGVKRAVRAPSAKTSIHEQRALLRFFGAVAQGSQRLAPGSACAATAGNGTTTGTSSRLGYHYVGVTTPTLRELNGDSPYATMIGRRNGALSAQLQAMRAQLQSESPSVSSGDQSGGLLDRGASVGMLDFAGLLRGFTTRELRTMSKDSKHFLCAQGRPFPGVVAESAGDLNGCYDDVNRGMWTWLLRMLLELAGRP